MPTSYDGASVRAYRTLPRLITLVLTAALAATGFVVTAPTAHARELTFAQKFENRADRVLHVASNQKGDPYRYGAAGPGRFDCSGLVLFVFQRALGKSLPHSADAQMHRATRITRSQARPGDLVFQVSDGYAYHVGIYAGHGYMWDASHTGTVVHKRQMYNSHWRYGRLIHPNR